MPKTKNLLTDKAFWDAYTKKLKALHNKWEPHDKQAQVLEAIFKHGKKRVFIRAGRRSGKSEVAMYVPNRIAGLFPNKSCLIVGPKLKQQKKIMWKNGKLPTFAPPIFGGEPKEGDATIYFPNHSYIELDGSEDWESHRGTEYDVVIIDEYKDIEPRFVTEIIAPTLATTDGILITIGTPPKSKDNHYYQTEMEVKEDPDWAFFKWTSWDNPHVDKDWLKKEKAKYYKRGDKDIWDREYEAEYVFGGKSHIFPMFNSKKHVKSYDIIERMTEKDRSRMEWFVSCDPATSSTFAVSFIGYNRHTSQIFIMDEIYNKNRLETSSAEIWNQIQQKKKAIYPRGQWRYIYDEAAAWFANEISAQFGIGMIPSKKRSAEKDDGISLLKDIMLRPNCLFIARSCINTIFEIENYITDDNGRYIKKNDHILDAIRYFLDTASVNFIITTDYEEETTSRYVSIDEDFRTDRLEEDFTAMIEDFDSWI